MSSPRREDASGAPPDERAEIVRVLRFERVEPEREQAYRLVHLQPGRASHRRWFELLDRYVDELPRIMRPRGIFRIDKVASLSRRRILTVSGVSFDGGIGEYLAHSQLLATYVVTIGSAVERLSRGWLRAGKVMQGTLADAVASQAAEAVSQMLGGEVRAWAQQRGLDVTPPYSPGYCGMDVRQQIPLFSALPTARINVRLTPSCLMLPVKSISGLIGIGPVGKVSPDGYPCEGCDHPTCPQRRAPFAGRRS